MWYLFNALLTVSWLVAFICFIMVVMAMFKAGDQTLGIICSVLCFCGNLGMLVALVMGWVNADKYNIRKILPIYSAAFAGVIIFGVMSGAFMPNNVMVINQQGQVIQP
jgi:hypothetical protein